jgi:hypothetical protein
MRSYKRKEVAARVTFVTLFFLKLNLKPPTPRTSREGGFSAFLFSAAAPSNESRPFSASGRQDIQSLINAKHAFGEIGERNRNLAFFAEIGASV